MNWKTTFGIAVVAAVVLLVPVRAPEWFHSATAIVDLGLWVVVVYRIARGIALGDRTRP